MVNHGLKSINSKTTLTWMVRAILEHIQWIGWWSGNLSADCTKIQPSLRATRVRDLNYIVVLCSKTGKCVACARPLSHHRIHTGIMSESAPWKFHQLSNHIWEHVRYWMFISRVWHLCTLKYYGWTLKFSNSSQQSSPGEQPNAKGNPRETILGHLGFLIVPFKGVIDIYL
jgi:hypothetical protein